MIKSLFVVGLIILVSGNIHLNEKYRHVLFGASPLNDHVANEIYSQFTSVYKTKNDQRFTIFNQTLHLIRQHNMGDHTWIQGINDYSDLTWEEFKELRLMAPQNCSATHNLKVSEEQKLKAIPQNYDWLSYGVVTPVKNQGGCGSCWTFSTVGSLQAFWNIQGKGKNITFSEQQLVDCAGDFNNFGCNGGLPSQAFEYIKHAGGIETDVTYTYTAKDGSCKFRPGIAVGYVKYGSYNITEGDQTELAERLYNAGPIAISFQVINDFGRYAGGVYKTPNCGTTTQDINHAVLATGYGVQNGEKFWNVKNSWGATWGVNGYFKIARDVNMCAISQCNSYPLIDRADGLHGLQEII